MVEERRKDGLATTLLPLATTRLRDLPLPFGQVCIFRDLPRCDHMVYFKDLAKDAGLAQAKPQRFPLQVYYPRIVRRSCQTCEVRYARVVTKRDRLSPHSINFYCKKCYEDLHLE